MKFVHRLMDGLRPFLYMVSIPFLLLVPRRKRKVVLGAWEGDMFSDNPKYLGLYLSEHRLADCIWIGKPHLRSVVERAGLKFAKFGSFSAMWHRLTASWYVFCISYEKDIGFCPNCGRARLLNLWHGIPYKRIGCRQGGRVAGCSEGQVSAIRHCYRTILSITRNYLFPHRMVISVSSDKMAGIMCDAWPSWFHACDTLRFGTPRSDIMVKSREDGTICSAKKLALSERFGWPLGKKWYLYMPTWRGNGVRNYSFAQRISDPVLKSFLDFKNVMVIEKLHHSMLKGVAGGARAQSDNVVVMTKEQADDIDVQELLLAADRLITDYSSCFFDFELTGRPVIHFAYDLEEYETSMAGVNYRLADIAAGPIARTEEELLNCLSMSDEELLGKKGPKAGEPLAFELGHACESIAKYMGLVKQSQE